MYVRCDVFHSQRNKNPKPEKHPRFHLIFKILQGLQALLEVICQCFTDSNGPAIHASGFRPQKMQTKRFESLWTRISSDLELTCQVQISKERDDIEEMLQNHISLSFNKYALHVGSGCAHLRAKLTFSRSTNDKFQKNDLIRQN